MMSLNYVRKKCTGGYKLSKSQEKINFLMYMDDIKLFAKNEKELETLKQNARRKGNLQILGNIGSEHHQTSGDERKY